MSERNRIVERLHETQSAVEAAGDYAAKHYGLDSPAYAAYEQASDGVGKLIGRLGRNERP